VGDGNVQLVASVDYSGRRFFNTVLVVRRTGTGYAVQRLPALNVTSLAAAVVDLDGDGRQELVLPTALTPYLGAAYPQAKWDAIYAWSGKLYVESTATYAGYYRANVLAPLRQRLVNASVANDAVPLALARIEHDKALRVLPAANPDAGVATAQSLASNADPKLRILGAAVAADIGSPDAAVLLGRLAADGNRDVARYAKRSDRTAPHRSLRTRRHQRAVRWSAAASRSRVGGADTRRDRHPGERGAIAGQRGHLRRSGHRAEPRRLQPRR